MAKTDFLTPVGRLVQGDPFEPQTTDQQGKPLVTLSGQPTQRYFIAVAFKKDDPAFPALYQKLVEIARGSFPQLFDAAGNCTHPRFSWKLMDGDGVDDNGKPNANKEGFAGHWVVKFQSSFAPRCFHAGHYQPHEQIQDKNAIQRGYFVRVAGTIEGNDNVTRPGIYVNLSMVELAGVGPVITSGPDASAVFGSAAPNLPQGAQPLPMNASLPAPALVAPGLPSTPGMAPIASTATTSPTNPLPVPPHPGFLAGPAVPPPPVPAPAVPQLTAAAGGASYQDFKNLGWTDEQMRAAGYLA